MAESNVLKPTATWSKFDPNKGNDFYAMWLNDGQKTGGDTPSVPGGYMPAPNGPSAGGRPVPGQQANDWSNPDSRRQIIDYAGENRGAYDPTRDPGSSEFVDPNSWRGQIEPQGRGDSGWSGGGSPGGGGGFESPRIDGPGGSPNPYDSGRSRDEGSPSANPVPYDDGGGPSTYDPSTSRDEGYTSPSMPTDPTGGSYNPDPSASGGSAGYDDAGGQYGGMDPGMGGGVFETPSVGEGAPGTGGGGQEQAPSSGNWDSGETYNTSQENTGWSEQHSPWEGSGGDYSTPDMSSSY